MPKMHYICPWNEVCAIYIYVYIYIYVCVCVCDNTVAGPAARRDNVLAGKCEYPPFRYPLLNSLRIQLLTHSGGAVSRKDQI